MFPVLIQGYTLVCLKATACHVDMPGLIQQFKELSAALVFPETHRLNMTFVMFKGGFSNLVCIRYVEFPIVSTNTALDHVTCSQGVVVQPDMKECQIKENLSKYK